MSRWRVTFWLDDQKPDDFSIGKTVLELKQKRQFARAVKDGIRLITSLRAGNTDVLFELFPHLEAQLEKRFAPATPPNSDEMKRQIEAAVQAGVEQAMLNMPSLPSTPLVGAPLKPYNAPPVAAIKAAAAPSVDEIHDNFMAFLQ